jgi:hypothetical protein
MTYIGYIAPDFDIATETATDTRGNRHSFRQCPFLKPFRKRAPRNLTPIPHDYPNANRLGGSDLFRTVLGGTPKSTFARWLAAHILPAPTRVCGLNMWPEETMADVTRNGTRSPASAPQAQSADAAIR